MKTSCNQYNGTNTEMHLAGLGYKSMRIEYNINATTIPALADNDSFVVQLTAIFDGSYKATRVEVRDHSSNQLIKQQVITNPPNNFGTPVFIGFSVGSLDSVDIIVRAEFTNTSSYVPNTIHGGDTNWTNGIYLRNWHLTHYRRNTKEEVISDTSDYFYRNKYAFGFQSQYRDDEILGNGNSYAFNLRMLDSRLGRWFSVDPLASKFPFYSPYHFAGNTPIVAIDLEGAEDLWIHYKRQEDGSLIIVEDHESIFHKPLSQEYREILTKRLDVQGEVPNAGVVETVMEMDGKTYVKAHNDMKIVEITPEKNKQEAGGYLEALDRLAIKSMGKNVGEMEGEAGLRTYSEGLNNTGIVLQYVPIAPITFLGVGLGIASDVIDSGLDYKNKDFTTASTNTITRIAVGVAGGRLGKAADKLPATDAQKQIIEGAINQGGELIEKYSTEE